MADRIKGITIEIGGDTTKLSKALSGVNKEIRETQSSLKDVEKLLKMDPGNMDLLKQKQELLKNAVKETKDKLDTLKKAQEQMDAAGVDKNSEAYQKLCREIVETEQKLKSATKELRNFSAVGEKIKNVASNIKDAGDKVSGVGKELSAKVTAPIVGVGTALVAMASGFEDAMAKVATIADTSQVPLEQLRAEILNLSNETGVASESIADAVYNAISAGQETGNAVNFVANATKLATAGFTDTGSALDVLTTIMNAYGMEADEVTKVSDTLIQTQNMGKTTVAELASYMGKVIPTAKASNVSLEQVAAAYAKLTANGIKTAESTTYLNGMMNELSKSGTKVSDAIKEQTGKSFQELMADGYSLTDVLKIVQTAADESGKSFGDMWSSAEAGKAATVLSDTTNKLGDFNAAVEQMSAAEGATETAFETMNTSSFEFRKVMNELKNTMTELGTTLLEMLQPALEKMAEAVQGISEWIGSLDEAQKETIMTIALVVAAIGPALVIIGTVISSVGTIISAIGSFITICGTVVSVLGGPVTLAIAAIIAIVVALITHWEKVKEAVQRAVEIIRQNIESFKSDAVSKFEEVKNKVTEFVTNMLSAVTENVTKIKDTIVEKFGEAVTFIEELPGKALTWGKDLIQNFVDGILEKWNALKETVSGIAEGIADFLGFSEPKKGPLSNFHTYAPDMMDLYAKGIKENQNLVTNAVSGLAGSISEIMNSKQTSTANINLKSTLQLDGRVIAEQVNRQLGVML